MTTTTQHGINDLAIANQFGFAIASNNVPKYSQSNLFGYCETVPSGESNEVAIDPSCVDYVFPTTAQPFAITSTVSEDLDLIVIGLDINYNIIVELVTMIGTSVPTVNDFFRILVAEVDANRNSVTGNITIAHPDHVNSKIMIEANHNISHFFGFSVPADRESFIQSINLYAGDTKEVTYKFYIREAVYNKNPDGTNNYNSFLKHKIWKVFNKLPLVESTTNFSLDNTPFLLTPMSDVIIKAFCNSSTTAVSASATFTNRKI